MVTARHGAGLKVMHLPKGLSIPEKFGANG
jgi:hypothetical protein